jgi:hypothetical protein
MRSPSGDDQTAGLQPYYDIEGDFHLNGSNVFHEGVGIRLGTPTICTIASGVLTVTGSFIAAAAESGTSDTVDSIVWNNGAPVGAGDYLLIVPDTGDTITFDDANINLGAATRAVAPGGHISLYYDGTEWTELTFLTASDNA